MGNYCDRGALKGLASDDIMEPILQSNYSQAFMQTTPPQPLNRLCARLTPIVLINGLLLCMAFSTTLTIGWGTLKIQTTGIINQAIAQLHEVVAQHSAMTSNAETNQGLLDQTIRIPHAMSAGLYQRNANQWQKQSTIGPQPDLSFETFTLSQPLPDNPHLTQITLPMPNSQHEALVLVVDTQPARHWAGLAAGICATLWIVTLILCNGLLNQLWIKLLRQLPKLRNELDSGEPTAQHSPLTTLQNAIRDAAHELGTLRRRIYQLHTQVDLQDYSLKESQVVQQELERARREAMEAHLSQSTFLASMSHELRTPLHSIIGYADLLLNSDIRHELIEPIETIQMAGDNLLALVNNILDYTKLVSGNLALYNEPFHLPSLIDSSLALLGPQLGYKAVECVPLIYDDVPLNLIGDSLRIRQILLNLVGNAIKHTDEGDIVIRAMLENIESESVRLRFTIVDTGEGLGTEDPQKLFEAFHQAYGNKQDGAGLGLAISKRLVEVMNGEIGCYNNEFGGATFWFTISLGVASEELSPAPATTPHTLLLVEPHDRLRLVLSKYLSSLGHTIEASAHWPETPTECDGIICGLSPYADNPETSTHIRHIEALNKPAIWLCSHSQIPILKEIDDSRPKLIKPIIRSRLNSLIGHAIESHDTQQKAALPSQNIDLLAVDDHPANLKLLKHLIEELGYQCDTAQDGQQAVEAAVKRPYSLIIMDMKMPVMDGLTATRAIRESDTNADTPIVILTAHAMANEQQALIQAGASAYSMKPISKQQLESLIKKWAFDAESSESEAPHTDSAPTTTSPLPSTQWIEWDQSLALVNHNEALARDMLSMFIDSLDNDAKLLEQAWANNDHGELKDIVHKIHGASRYCGLPKLSTKLKKAEFYLNRKPHAPLATLCESLLIAFTQTQAEAKEFLKHSQEDAPT